MVLAIEADGASYRQSRSVRDRDRLRGEHLQRLGWHFHRLWSTNWFQNPQAEVARLRDAYQRAISSTGPRTPGSAPPPGHDDLIEPTGEVSRYQPHLPPQPAQDPGRYRHLTP